MQVEAAAHGDQTSKPQPFSREALERELNEAQVEAVMHPPGPLLVVAGAGSGKTRVITYRLARLVATGADPRRIMAVTFTNKAAGELRERVDNLLGTGWGSARAGCGSAPSTPPARACCAGGARRSGCARTSSSTTTTIRSGCWRACSRT